MLLGKIIKTIKSKQSEIRTVQELGFDLHCKDQQESVLHCEKTISMLNHDIELLRSLLDSDQVKYTKQ